MNTTVKVASSVASVAKLKKLHVCKLFFISLVLVKSIQFLRGVVKIRKQRFFKDHLNH
jgi:hypothetical protein